MLKQLSVITFVTLVLASTTFAAERMSVAFSGAEVRSSASAMSSKVLFQAEKYYPLNVIQEGVEYLQVSDYRNRKGYIHKSLLKARPAVVVTGDRANVRSGPGTSNDVVFQLAKGDSALMTDSSDGWVEIMTAAGQKGWIADFLVWGD